MKMIYLYTKRIFQIFVYLVETLGISCILTYITNIYLPAKDIFENIERITVYYALYQIIIYNILQQLNDIKKDEYLAVLTMYKYVQIYNNDKRKEIKEELYYLINKELDVGTFNDNSIREEYMEIKNVLDNNLSIDTTLLETKILRYEHLSEEAILNWKYSLLLRVLK